MERQQASNRATLTTFALPILLVLTSGVLALAGRPPPGRPQLVPSPRPSATPTVTLTPTPRPTRTLTLCPGQTATETWETPLQPAPPRADVVFVVDTSRTMDEELLALYVDAQGLPQAVQRRFPDVRFGLVAFSDYPAPPYGSPSDVPYRLVQPLTPDLSAVGRALQNLELAWGGDPPDAYARVLYEAAADPRLGWRSNARRFLVLIGDSFPHDDDLNAGVPTPQPYRPGEPWITGYPPTYRDPGPDATPGTADDLDFQTVLALLRARGITLLSVVTSHARRGPSGAELAASWKRWAQQAGAGSDALHIPHPFTGIFGTPRIRLTLVPRMVEAGQHIGRLVVEAFPADYAAWVITVPPAYTDLRVPSGGRTVEWQVTLHVPPETPPGTYAFLLWAVGDGAVYAEQSVTVHVPSQCGKVPTWTPTASPTATPPPPTPTPTLPPDRCILEPDKWADPAELDLGETTEITLRLAGACPTPRRHVDLMLVLDVSDYGTLDVAKPVIRAFVDGLDLEVDQVGLVSYGRYARVDVPLGRDRERVQRVVSRLGTRYLIGPNLGHGIALAQGELESERRNPAAVPVIVLLASPRPNILPAFAVEAAARARAAGIRIFAIGPSRLVRDGIVASPDDRFSGGTVETLFQALEHIANIIAHDYRANVAATQVTVRDVLSPNVAYLPGSAKPEPTVTGDTLTWHLPSVPLSGAKLTYRVLPLLAGRYPANAAAWAELIDGEGNAVTVPFPNPQLIVHARQPDAALCPNESATLTVPIHLAPVTARADLLLAFDTTADMFKLIPVVRDHAAEVFDRLAALIPDLRVSVVDFRDYPREPYGEAGDWPYRLVQPLTGDRGAVIAALQGLVAGGGGDPPEAYTRVLYESYSDPALRWRPGARRFLVVVGNQMPHDDDLNAGVPPPQPYHPNEPWPTGYPPSYLDPGRDGYPGTSDDLDLQAVLREMGTHGIPLLRLVNAPRGFLEDRLVYWRYWAELTGTNGLAMGLTDETRLPETLASLVATASGHLRELHIEVVPQAYAAWVHITPEAYIDLTVPSEGLTVTFDVTITVPSGVVAGQHTFLLRAVGDGAVYDERGLVIEVPATCQQVVTPTPTATAPATLIPSPSATPTATASPTPTTTPTATIPVFRPRLTFLPLVARNLLGVARGE